MDQRCPKMKEIKSKSMKKADSPNTPGFGGLGNLFCVIIRK